MTIIASPPPSIAPRRAPIYGLFTATGISLVGSQLTVIAIPWFVLTTTGSPAKTGLTAFAEALAAILAAFFGGTFVDRLGHKRASVVADLASGAIVALVPLLYATAGLTFWQLLPLVFLRSFFDTPGNTARAALRPDATTMANMPPERVNGGMQAIQRGAGLVGAPLAGVLIALLGTSQVLWLDAGSFAISAAIVGVLLPGSVARAKETGPYLAAIADGLRYIRQDRLLLAIATTVGVTNFLGDPLFAVVMPVYVRERFGSPLALGAMAGAFGGGAMLGAVVFGIIGRRLPRRATFIGAFNVAPLSLWILALLPPLPIILITLIARGIVGGPLNPIIDTVKQERVPIALRGRVYGTITAIAFAAIPLGMALAGYLVEWIGVRATLFVMAIAYLATSLSMLINPALRGMDIPVQEKAT